MHMPRLFTTLLAKHQSLLTTVTATAPTFPHTQPLCIRPGPFSSSSCGEAPRYHSSATIPLTARVCGGTPSRSHTVRGPLPTVPEAHPDAPNYESQSGIANLHEKSRISHTSSLPTHNEHGILYLQYAEENRTNVAKRSSRPPKKSAWWNKMTRLMEQFRSLMNEDAYYNDESKECRQKMAGMAGKRVKAPDRVEALGRWARQQMERRGLDDTTRTGGSQRPLASVAEDVE